VAIEAAKWTNALVDLGFSITTVAGEGSVDHRLPGLAIGAESPPTVAELRSALDDADLVVVENLCSLPLNPAAADLVATTLAGRPAVLHHHDLPWQRPQFASHGPPPDDPHWSHVTINELSRAQLADRGITATTVYNTFDTRRSIGHDGAARTAVRRTLGLTDQDRLVVQPTRALPRKNVAAGMAAANDLGATFWLVGSAEDGYGPELERLVEAATGPVVLGWPDGMPVGIDAAYAAADVIALPSTWEGFGNPSVESAVHRRPLLIGPYPVATELAAFGFRWFGLDDLASINAWLREPNDALLDHNWLVADTHFSDRHLPSRLARVLPAI